MKRLVFVTAAPVCMFLSASSLSAQLRNTKALTLEAAKTMVAAAESSAGQNGWNVAIAIVDAGGHLVLFHRRDGTQIGSIDVALRKAKSAVAFRRPTKALDDAVSGGRTALLAVDVMPLEGGVPIVVDDDVIGAIGVSGVTSQQDAMVAQAGLDALVR